MTLVELFFLSPTFFLCIVDDDDEQIGKFLLLSFTFLWTDEYLHSQLLRRMDQNGSGRWRADKGPQWWPRQFHLHRLDLRYVFFVHWSFEFQLTECFLIITSFNASTPFRHVQPSPTHTPNRDEHKDENNTGSRRVLTRLEPGRFFLSFFILY